jgi:FAD/FMN-containing dehydrogenase
MPTTRLASSGFVSTTRATAPHSEAGGYINFMSDDDQGRVQDNDAGNYQRLVEVKRAYDPGNLFHHNQNIKP